MATTITLTGRLADITSMPVEEITSCTVKAPAYRPGPGVEITTSQPQKVNLTGDGEITIQAVEGVGWLYLDGPGWSDSIRFVAAAGMTKIWEAVANAMGIPANILEYLNIKQSMQEMVNKAVANAPSTLRWYKGLLPKNTDLNNMFGYEKNGAFGLDNSQSGAIGTYSNLPEVAQGTLTVLSTPQGFTTQIFQAFGSGNYWTRSQTTFGKPEWTKWVNAAVTTGDQIPLSTDMDTLFGKDWAGNWSVDNKTKGAIDSYSNLPEVAQGTLTVKVSAEGFTTQTFQAFGSGNYWTRSQTAFGKPEWTKWVNLTDSGDDSAFEHDLRVARARDRKLPDKVSNIAVALVLDHGTNTLDAELIPLLRELNMPVTIALNSGMYNPDDVRYKYNDKTSWATIQSWATDPLIEICNHGVTHGNVPDPEEQKWEVEQSLTDLEKNLPGVPIDSFVCPAGLTNVNDMLGFTQHAGTRAMYAKHAVIVTAVTPQRWPLAGEPRLGMSRFWAETPAGIAKSKSDILATPRGWGTMVSFHPEVLGQDGKASLDEAKEFIRWLAQQRDEGKITLLTLRDIAFAQAA